MAVFFPAPATFTGEDVVELHVHGSRAVVKAVLEALSRQGSSSASASSSSLRTAQPGEFTRRAFDNGKMTALDVEALSDLVNADTERQRRQWVVERRGDGWL